MNTEYVGYRIKLYPTEEQIKTFEKYFGACRFVYNLGIDLHNEYYEASKNDDSIKNTLSFIEMNNKFTSLKKEDKYYWLNNFDSTSLKIVLRDVVYGYKIFFNKNANHPKYKSKKNHHQMFPIRSERLKVYESSVYLPSIGEIDTGINKSELIGNGYNKIKNSIYKKYINSRVVYDGYSYWLAFTLEKDHKQGIECNSCKRFINNEVWNHKPYSDDVGIDLGCNKNKWIVDSQGTRVIRPDTSKSETKIKKFQRKLACKRRVNDKKFEEELLLQQGEITNPTLMKARRRYSNNELKILKKMNKEYKHKTNIKKNVIHEYACNLIETKPRSVTMETLKVRDMLLKDKDIPRKHRDRHNKMVYESMLYTVIDIIDTKCSNNGIPVIYANDDYPSSQLCSRCGNRYRIGKSNTYHCPSCGLDIDRDYNASLNLRDFQYSSYCNTNSIAV